MVAGAAPDAEVGARRNGRDVRWLSTSTRRRSSLGLVVLLAVACGGDAEPPVASPPESAATAATSDDDLAVYDAVLRELGGLDEAGERGRSTELLVVSSESASLAAPEFVGTFAWLGPAADDPAAAPDWITEHFPTLDPTCLQDFARENLVPAPLPPLVSAVPVTLVSPQLMEEIDAAIRDAAVEGGDAWGEFWRRYPTSSGVVGFSRIGYGGDGVQALVYCDRRSGYESGEGWLVLLSRVGGWHVEVVSMVWIS